MAYFYELNYMYKTQRVQKCHLNCSIYKIGGVTAVFVLLVLQIIRTSGPPDNSFTILSPSPLWGVETPQQVY